MKFSINNAADLLAYAQIKMKIDQKDVDNVVTEIFESLWFLITSLRSAKHYEDVYRAVFAVTRFITKKTFGQVLTELFAKLFGEDPEVQAGNFDVFSQILENYAAVKESPIIKKVQNICSAAVAAAMLDKCGISLATQEWMQICADSTKKMFQNLDFMAAIIDLVSFMYERALQCWRSGSIRPFLHSSQSYVKWSDEAYDLIEISAHLANPEAIGIVYSEFLQRLDDAIRTGQEIRDFSKSADTKNLVAPLLAKIKSVKNEVLTRTAAGERRAAPYALLLNGGSGIGKSSIAKMTFSHLAKALHLPEGNEYIYTRSPGSDFYDNFKPQQNFILLDDMGFANPNKATTDETVNQCLQIINSVPFCPPQAELENKGKTPMRPDVVIGTTNTAHLNAMYYYSNWVAVLRRFEDRFDICPKPEYARPDAPAMLDASKVPDLVPGEYQDVWIFKHMRVLVKDVGDKAQQENEFLVATYTDVNDYLQAVTRCARKHREQQAFVMNCDEMLKEVKLCGMCDRALAVCHCELQAQERSESSWPIVLAAGAIVGAGILYYKRAAIMKHLVRKGAQKALLYTKAAFAKRIAELGEFVQFGGLRPMTKRIAAALGTAAVIYAGYKMYQQTITALHTAEEEDHPIFKVGTVPTNRGDEKESPYVYRDTFHVALEEPHRARSWASMERTEVCSKLAKNVYFVSYRRKVGDRVLRSDGRALCLGGHLFVTDDHVIPDADGEISIVIESGAVNLNRNLTKTCVREDFFRLPERELVFFQINDVPAHRRVDDLIPHPSFSTTCPGALLDRKENGEMNVQPVARTSVSRGWVADLRKTLDLWTCTTDDLVVGHCGTPLVAFTPQGPMIVGLHLLGGPGLGSKCVRLDSGSVSCAIDHYGTPIIEPAPPLLQSSVRTVNLTSVHHKSVFRFMGEGNVIHYGTTDIPRAMGKSKVCASILRPHAVARGYEVKVGAPVMTGWKLWRNAALPIVTQAHAVEEHVLKVCAQAYRDDVLKGLSEEDLADLKGPISMMVAVNGVPGFRYLDAMKRGTSAGFPWNKSKRNVLKQVAIAGWNDAVVPSREVLDRAAEMIERYKRGVRCSPVFMAHKKDEPLGYTKVINEKTRIMYGAPFDWSIVVRMYYMPFIWVMMRNKFLFEAMPGLVAQCSEWEELYQHLTQFGDKCMIAGDYEKYDKNMCAVIILLAFGVIIDLAKVAGATEETQLIMWGIAEDTAFAFVVFNGDLVQFFGSNPSGHPLTVVINCIVGSLYMRFAFVKLSPEDLPIRTIVEGFKKNVALATYGDDMVAGSRVQWFNHTAIVDILKSIGIGYTMADKVAESIPFIPMEDVTFLKRRWRFEPTLGAHVCPLDEDSIHKMLTTWIPSDSVSPEEQAQDVIATSVREYFWYGRDVFEEKRRILGEIFYAACPAVYAKASTFPTWEDCCAAWRNEGVGMYTSGHIEFDGELQARETWVGRKLGSPCTQTVALLCALAPAVVSAPNNRTPAYLHPYICQKWGESGWWSFQEQDTLLWDYSVPSVWTLIEAEPLQSSDVSWSENPLNNTQKIKETTQHVCVPKPQEIFPGRIQSEELAEGTMSIRNQENLQFRDAGLGRCVQAPPMPTYQPDIDSAGALGNFLSRPVLIDTYNWLDTDTGYVQKQFQPWKLFFNDPAIKRKMDNYARVRCRLHLKFVLNASPFYFGSMRACYVPLNDGREVVNAAFSLGQQVGFSQQPGVFLEPAVSTSEEIVLPFIWPKNWIDATKAVEFENMGTISYMLYAALRSANGAATANCRISCYAWAEDVEIAGLTSVLSVQSDEYAEGAGPVSGVATAVADVAHALGDVPIIGEYARATEMGANMIAGVASLFGYSNPPVTDDVIPVSVKSFHAFSNVDTRVPSDKLTLDPKNEVTIDTAAVGAGSEDELVLKTFCGRESFLQGTLWQQSAGLNTILWTAPVTPINVLEETGTSRTGVNMTPAAFAGRAFAKWRGSITYRFRFVKSRYHTGRVLISWEPSGIPSLDSETTSFTRLVDLQYEDEVSVTIPYKAASTWLSTRSYSNNFSDTTSPTVTYNGDVHNGGIQMRVQNTLTGPAASASLDILVFVSAGPDIEYAVPNELPANISFYEVQTAEVVESEIVEGSGAACTANNASITTGENIVTLRTLLHRSSFHMIASLGDQLSGAGTYQTAGHKSLTTLIPRVPRGPGYDPQGIHWASKYLTAGNVPYNFVPMHPITWIVSCFAGYRGGVVHHVNTISNGCDYVDSITAENLPINWVIRQALQGRNRQTLNMSLNNVSNSARAGLGLDNGVVRFEQGQRGMSLTNARTQAALSVVSPQYSSWKFRPGYGNSADLFPTGVGDELSSLRITVRANCGGLDGAAPWPYANVYTAAAVDFTPVYFVSVPQMYSYNSPTANDAYAP